MSEPRPLAEVFGERMKAKLDELGKRPVWLASEANLSVASIFAYAGGTRAPNLEAAVAIADVLGVPLDWLAGRQKQI